MTRSILRLATLTFAFVCGFSTLQAQSPVSLRPLPQSNRVAAGADLGPQTQLTGHIPGWVSKGVPTAKAVDLNANMELTIVLQRDPAVQAAFTQFLADQQTPGNPLYHQWITPQQVGTLFGPTATDLAAVTSWLTAQGLIVDEVQPNQVMINVHGATAAVGSAFRTSFGYFPLNGVSRLSAVSEPSVPTALSPVVSAVFGLTDLPLYPNSILSGPHAPDVMPGSGSASPGLTPKPEYTTSSGTHYMSPGDFAIVYDSASVLSGGNKGAGTSARVAVIGRSRVAATDISEFATNMGIGSGYTLNTVIPGNGVDPGVVCTYANANTCSTGGDQGEQTLDVDRVIGNAPNATVDLIVATSLTTALQWNVNTVKDPIMTISYGGCESQTGGTAAALTYDGYYSTAAAEGVSTFVSSGDSGVNGCATAFAGNTTTYVAGPNYLCSSSYVTCVGGTEFIDPVAATYWASTNTTNPTTGMTGSVLSYMPEGAWNEPGTAAPFTTTGTGGGPSLAIAKPSWQTGTGVPADGHRDTPDVSYPAAQHDSYYACLDYQLGSYNGQGTPPITSASNCTTAGGGYFFGFAGTSAAAPAMAGVTALLNTKLGAAQGNLNPMFYTLAATSSNGVFHDVTPTTSGVTGCSITVPSPCNNSTPGSSALSTSATGGQQGFLVQTGYDQATGLGSIDVAKWLTAATPSTVSTTLALTTVTPNPVAVNNTVTLTATLTRSSTTPGAATGTVTFYYTPSGGSATLINSAITISNNVATTTTTFSTAGTYTITAVYSGDTNYSTSTAAGVSLTVTPGPSFTVVPALTSINLISGGTTGNTDTVTLTSTNAFVGAVTMSCTVTNTSGTAAGTCATTGPVTLTSGGTGTSTLTITTTPGTSGVLSVTVKGTSGATVITSSAITVNLTASSFTAGAGTAITIVAGSTSGTSSFTVTSVNGFVGTVSFTCAASNPSVTNAGTTTCTASPVTLTAGGTGTSNVSLTTTLGASGSSTLTINGSGTTTGATIAATASTTVSATVAPPSFTESAPSGAGSSINPSGATTGNTLTSNLASTAFAGTVSFTCTLTPTSGSPANPATCAASSVPLVSGGVGTTTITVTSTTAHSGLSGPQHAGLSGWGLKGGALLATLLCLVPFRRRRFVRPLAALIVLAFGMSALSGCSGGAAPAVKSSSDGTYTGTINGTGTSTGAGAAFSTSATFTVTITN